MVTSKSKKMGHIRVKDGPATKGTDAVWFHFHEIARVVRFTETREQGGGCQELGEGGVRYRTSWVWSFGWGFWKGSGGE